MTEMRVITTGLCFPEGQVPCTTLRRSGRDRATDGQPRLPNGRIEVIARTGGGPNGLAVGPDGAFYVCNNGGFAFRYEQGILRPVTQASDYTGGRIERVDPDTGATAILYDRCGDHKLRGPNDIVFDRHGGFYFTDLGKSRARDRDHGGLYYALADRSRITEVAYPLLTPNGVGLSPDGNTAYVAETETARLWAFDLEGPGVARKQPFPSPHGGRLIVGLGGFQRFDSLAVDAVGNICIATLVSGCISVIAADGRLLRQVCTGDPMTTNICFGGPGLRTAYVTLSGAGRLVAFDWPEAGLPMAYQM